MLSQLSYPPMQSISKSCTNYIRHGAHVNLTETHEEAQHVALSTFMTLPRWNVEKSRQRRSRPFAVLTY